MAPRSKKISEQMRAESHAALLAAGRKVFAEHGYFNTTVSQIAQQAGMSQGNLYWYFASKEDLLKAILADGFESMGQILEGAADQDIPPDEQIEQIIDAYIRFGHERGHFTAILMSLMGHGGPEFIKQLGFDMLHYGMRYHQALGRVLAARQQRGSAELELPPDLLAMFFFAFFNGLQITYGEDWLQIPPEVLKQAMLRLLGSRTE